MEGWEQSTTKYNGRAGAVGSEGRSSLGWRDGAVRVGGTEQSVRKFVDASYFSRLLSKDANFGTNEIIAG